MKQIKSSISKPLKILINNSYMNGIFPQNLKIASVTPIFKSGSKLDPNNYIPISVLAILPKVHEKSIYNRLIKFLNTYVLVKFYLCKQLGFRYKKNTEDYILNLFNNITKYLDDSKYTATILLT